MEPDRISLKGPAAAGPGAQPPADDRLERPGPRADRGGAALQ
jgi:hypothetical protein